MLKRLPQLFTGHAKSAFFFTMATALLCLLSVNNSVYGATISKRPFTKQQFDTVKTVLITNRVHVASTIYTDNLRWATASKAMADLNYLTTIAIGLNDKRLQCAVLDMRADYFSNNNDEKRCVDYYKQAIVFAGQNKLTFETGLYHYKLGMFYFIHKQSVSACEYFLKAQDIFRRIGYKNVPDIGYYLYNEANFYYSLGDFDNAKANLQEALLYTPAAKKRDKINMTNTIGLIYRNNQQYPEALGFFDKALTMATTDNDTIWMGITKGNIGSVYFLQHNYQKALPYIETDYNTSIKSGEKINGSIALLRLVKINIDGKKLDLANRQLQTAERILNSCKNDVLEQWATYYDLRSQLDEQLGDIKASILFRKKYELDKDSLLKRNNTAAVERVKLHYEINERIRQVNKFRADEKIHTVEIEAGIAASVLVIIGAVAAYHKQRVKTRKDKALLLAQKKAVDEKLKNAHVALNQFTENLRQKNVVIENFKAEIEGLKSKSNSEENAGILADLLQAHIMTDENWADFKKLFLKVYPGFFIALNKNYPNLSAADTRMLALIKLGLNNTEMANMLGITVEGIKKAKQRLRKKNELDLIKEIESGANF